METSKTSILRDKLQSLSIPYQGGINIIPHENILYLKSDNQYTNIYICKRKPDGEVLVINTICSSKNLTYYDRALLNKPFIKISSSHIVNINLVRKFINSSANGYVLLANNTELKVTNSFKPKVKRLFSPTL